jgi:hypothetical protein
MMAGPAAGGAMRHSARRGVSAHRRPLQPVGQSRRFVAGALTAGCPRRIVTSLEALRPLRGKTAMLTFLLWCLLFVFCWPLAILALVLYPIVWLLTLPFRLVGISVTAVFALLTALLFLPARALGQHR